MLDSATAHFAQSSGANCSHLCSEHTCRCKRFTPVGFRDCGTSAVVNCKRFTVDGLQVGKFPTCNCERFTVGRAERIATRMATTRKATLVNGRIRKGLDYRTCPTCQRKVTLPCVRCRTIEWIERQNPEAGRPMSADDVANVEPITTAKVNELLDDMGIRENPATRWTLTEKGGEV